MVNITGRDKILLHLMNQQEFKDTKGEVPYRICQRGIAEYVSLSRNRVSELLRDLVKKEKLDEVTRRVVGLERRRKVYFLTEKGRKKARELHDELKEKKVDVKVGEENERRKVKLENIDKFIETGDPLLSALNQMEDDVIDLTEEEEERENVFVGRQEEIEYLTDILEEVNDEGSFTVFVTGPAGIGKTRLVSEFKQKGAKEGFEFLSGKAFYETSEPYRPLREAFDRYEVLASMLEPKGYPKRQGVEDKETFDAERHAEWYEITQKMKEIAANRPLVVFLDDLQWSDRATLELFHYMAAELTDSPILFLGIYRPEDLDADHPMVECRDRMIRENIFDELRLDPLDWEETSAIVKKQIGRKDLPDDFLKLVHQMTDGNPLFIRECINQMLEDETIKSEKNEYPKSTEEIAIPDVVDAVIQRRVNRLSDERVNILSKASVIGKDVPFKLLHKITDMKEVDLLDHLDVLIDTELLEDDPKEEVFSFSHDLIHLAVYDNISERVRQGYHRVVGEKMEELYQDELEGRYSDLGYHFEKAGEIKEAIECYRKAGEQAKSIYAHEDAISMYQKVLELMDEDHDVELDKPAILEGLGDAYKTIGEYEDAERYFRKALDEGHEKGRLWRKIALVYREKGIFEEALEFIEKGLSITEKDEIERCKCLGTKGGILMQMGDYDEAIQIFKRERDLAEELGDIKDKAKALHDLGTIYFRRGEFEDSMDYLERAADLREEVEDVKGLEVSIQNIGAVYIRKGEPEEALQYYERALDINQKTGNKSNLGSSLYNMGTVYWKKGDSEKALEYYERSLDIWREIGDKQGVSGCLNNIGNLHLDKGELNKASNYHEKSLEISEDIEDKDGIATSLVNLGVLDQSLGRLDESLELTRRALKIREEMGDKQGIASSLHSLGSVYLLKDDIEKAREDIEESLEIAEEVGDKSQASLNLSRLTEVWIRKGDLDKAEKRSERALQIAEERDLLWEEGMAHMFRGIVFGREERWGESKREFEEALELLDKTEDQGNLARAHYEYGSMLRAKDDEKKAKERLEKAFSMFEEMGMQVWTERAKEGLSSLSR